MSQSTKGVTKKITERPTDSKELFLKDVTFRLKYRQKARDQEMEMSKKANKEKTKEGVKQKRGAKENKAGYTATPVACRWAGAVLERVTRAFGQEQ